jgi:paraquat-inducible protein A
VHIGIALYALFALMITVVIAENALDREAVWESLQEAGACPPPARGLAPGPLAGCEVCGQVGPAGHGASCLRCGAALHLRKPDSVSRTAALMVAATILYLPANIFPVMSFISLGQGEPSTILGGVEELASGGMWPLALLVFFASITVPCLKLVGLAIMLVSVRRGWTGRLRDRTRLFFIIEFIGRWSMIDVFMVSILVALVQLGALVTIEPGFGAVCFCAVVILTMFAALSFDPRLMWDAAERSEERRLEERR